MSIKPFNHYAMENPASIYDEEALTALELAGRTVTKVNEIAKAFNDLETDTGNRLDQQDNAIPAKVEQVFQEKVEDGTFDDMIGEYAGDLSVRVDRLLGSIDQGSTSGDTELYDARIDNNGFMWMNAGNAIRGQFKSVDAVLNAISVTDRELVEVSNLSQGYTNYQGGFMSHTNYVTGSIDVKPGEIYLLDVRYGLSVSDAVLVPSNDTPARPYHGSSQEYRTDKYTKPVIIGEYGGKLWINSTKDYGIKVQKIVSYIPNFQELVTYVDNLTAPQRNAEAVTQRRSGDVHTAHVITDGVLSPMGTANNDFHVAVVPVQPGETLKISGANGYGNYFYSFYDKADNALTGSDQGSENTAYVKQEATVIAPMQATKILVAGNNGNPAVVNVVTGYKTGENGGSKGGYPDWSNLKWVCIGDSLTERNSRTTKNYHDYVAEKTGINVVNLGVSGYGYEGTDGSFMEMFDSIPSDADIITIFGSGNDLDLFNVFDLGTVNDDIDYGDESVAGYINNRISILLADYPKAQLAIVSPTPWVNHQPEDQSDMCDYADLLEKICKHRGIPFLNLFRCSNLRPNDEKFRELAYSKDDGNGVHPDETGHKMIAGHFYTLLQSLIGLY